MKWRCLNPKSTQYKWYAQRGIKVCDRWIDSFEAFLADMGERPLGKSLDRIDNNGDYRPGNCKWSTMKEQCENRRIRSNAVPQIRIDAIKRMITRGITLTAACSCFGMTTAYMSNRLKRDREKEKLCFS